MATYVLPPVISSACSQPLFALCGRLESVADHEVVLDASRLRFIDPFGLAVLGSLFQPTSRLEVSFEGLAPDVAGYLERMNFFAVCPVASGAPPARRRTDQRSNLVELTCVSDPREIDNAAYRLACAIVGTMTDASPDDPRDEMTCLNPFETYVEPLQYSLSELLENSLSHARRGGRSDAAVWVAAQYYKTIGKVTIAVVDNGCGMLATLGSHRELTTKTHPAAIVAALKPRVSCNRDVGLMSDSTNQGVGLTTTFRIAAAAKGGLTIVSGNGYHNTSGRTAAFPEPAFWNGVAIAVSCQRDALPRVRLRELLPPLDAPPVKVRFAE